MFAFANKSHEIVLSQLRSDDEILISTAVLYDFDRRLRCGSKHGITLLEFSMRPAAQGTSRVSPAISVCHNYQSFTSILSPTVEVR